MKKMACLATLMVGVLGACGPGSGIVGPGPSPSTSSVPSAPPSTSVTAEDLSGAWVFGEAAEPSAGPVVGCYPFKIWNLTQSGTRLTGSVNACIGPCAAFTEETQGTNQNGQVALSGEQADSPQGARTPVTYQLTFDARTKHLTGTRNGKPFWAAPFIQKSPEACGPAPL